MVVTIAGGTTSWSLDGATATCVNTANYNAAGSYSDSFSVSAPSSTGTHTLEFIVYDDNHCGSGASAPYVRQLDVVTNNFQNSYHFDETSWDGTAEEIYDSGGNNFHATAHDGATTASASPAIPGAVGTCGYGVFDGVDDYVALPTGYPDLTNDFTVTAWIRTQDNTRPHQRILIDDPNNSQGFGFSLADGGTGRVRLYSRSTSPVYLDTPAVVQNDQWYFVAAVADITNRRKTIYVYDQSGTQLAATTGTYTGSWGSDSGDASIGGENDASGESGYHFEGNIDEVRVHSGALTAADIDVLRTETHSCQLTCFNDDFNRTALGSDWAVSSRYGSFGVPRIVDNRLRLTDSSTYVATVASLLRLFPGAGNKIVYEFDQYAYNGSGADGMTVVLSDASITPVPGGYGGSLGYAQRSGQSGFTGGWLGMAIDEYGNFANDNEGRGDGGAPTARVLDSVTVRGSGAGMIGYLLHGNSGDLRVATGVGIDNSGSTTAAYGHRYRVTVDHTDNSHAWVTIDRDINDGSGYQTIVGPYDAMAQTNQAAVPTNWLFSMTGSTGGSRNIHEIDNLQVCATYMGSYNTIDHYRIYHDGSGLTCSPEYVSVQACMDADCTVTYAGQASAVLTTSSGWSSTQAFLSDLSNNAYLRSMTPGTVSFNIVGSSSDFVADDSPRCFIGATEQADCSMEFYDSGFIFDVPDHVAATSQSVTLSAVRTDVTTQQCVPGFSGVTRNLTFSSSYDNPTSGTLPVSVNSNSIASGGTGLALGFDANGEAALDVSYVDVGQITLTASYAGSVANGDDGLVMTGNDSFITRPDHFDLTIPANPSPVATDALGGVLTRAGDNFDVEVSARNANGDAAPNYGREVTPESVGLSAILVAPAGQSNPGIAGSFNAFGSDCAGTIRAGYACGQFSWGEVGIITLSPQVADGNYLGSGNVTGNTSENVGRFIPAYFSLADNGPSFADANGSFTYLGQPFSYLVPPRWTLTARNRSGGITSNYGVDFWHLNSALTQRSYQDNSGSLGGLAVTTSGAVSWSGTGDYDGVGQVSLTGEYLSYVKTAVAEGPLSTNIDLTLATADLTDSDAVCYDAEPDGTCDAYSISAISGTEQRYGQLLVQNAYGPETMDLTIPVLVEYFNGSAFVQNIADSSTAVSSANLILSDYAGTLVAGDTTPGGGGALSLGRSQAISLSAPLASHEGSVKLQYDLSAYHWLRQKDGTDPTARASFGIYKGNEKLIYMRESLW